MASHGGNREGSGRPAGAGNKATSGLKLNLSELAREYTHDALDALVEVMQSSQSDSARIAAATAILDRGYGRPTKTTALEVNAPFVPTTIQLVAYTKPNCISTC
jgi:hypothetical protein